MPARLHACSIDEQPQPEVLKYGKTGTYFNKLLVEFDKDLYIQEYVKTQFAGADTHALIVGFLRRIEPLFMHLRVFDEAEFWESDDLQLLRENLARCQLAIDEIAAQHPGCQYKVRAPDGRIVDLIT